MAWIKKTVNDMLVAEEVVTLPSSATYAYTSEIDFLKPNNSASRYIGLICTASGVSGTNIDISLHGAYTSTGAKYLLADAPGSIGDMTATALTQAATFNINPYPAPYYYIGLLCDADESANTVTVRIVVPTQAVIG